MSQKPIPPFYFVVHSFFQFIQCNFLSFFVCPHQYLAIVELIESHRDFGSSKRLIMYVGMACETVLINISLPILEIKFFLPSHDPLCNPLLHFFKSSDLRFSTCQWKTKVFFTIRHSPPTIAESFV